MQLALTSNLLIYKASKPSKKSMDHRVQLTIIASWHQFLLGIFLCSLIRLISIRDKSIYTRWKVAKLPKAPTRKKSISMKKQSNSKFKQINTRKKTWNWKPKSRFWRTKWTKRRNHLRTSLPRIFICRWIKSNRVQIQIWHQWHKRLRGFSRKRIWLCRWRSRLKNRDLTFRKRMMNLSSLKRTWKPPSLLKLTLRWSNTRTSACDWGQFWKIWWRRGLIIRYISSRVRRI